MVTPEPIHRRSVRCPGASLATRQVSPPGQRQASRWSFEMSMPMVVSVILSGAPCLSSSLALGFPFGSSGRARGDQTLQRSDRACSRAIRPLAAAGGRLPSGGVTILPQRGCIEQTSSHLSANRRKIKQRNQCAHLRARLRGNGRVPNPPPARPPAQGAPRRRPPPPGRGGSMPPFAGPPGCGPRPAPGRPLPLRSRRPAPIRRASNRSGRLKRAAVSLPRMLSVRRPKCPR